jgi:hypothetical protein
MEGIIVQPWITLRSASSNYGIVQSAGAWIDVGDFEDLVFYTDVREVNGGVTMTFETAPVAEDAAFVAMFAGFSVTTGVRVDSLLAELPAVSVPAARYVRWRLSGTASSWDLTFRVFASAYALN